MTLQKEESVRPKDGHPPPRRQVRYEDIAPLVGLDSPYESFNSFPTFHLSKSCIPTGLFKSVVQDMDILPLQYDLVYDPDLHEYNACEEFSRMFSPVSFSLLRDFLCLGTAVSEHRADGRH